MATCTPLYQIPYQTCDDRPCDWDTVECAAMGVIETNLDRIDAVINRTATTVPMVVVRNTAQDVYGPTSILTNFTYDTVLVDTDNMFTASSSSFVTINTSGFYIVDAQVQWHPVGSAAVTCSAAVEFDVNPGTSSPVPTAGGLFNELHYMYFRTEGRGSYSIAGMPFPLPAGSRIFTPNVNLIQDTMTLRLVELSAIWVGDLA